MARSKKQHIFKRVYVRHHCVECNSRCFPYDKYEVETASPIDGVKRPNILLKTYNSSHKDSRVAWCWACGGFKQMNRVLEYDILKMYLERDGVKYRNEHQLRLSMGR